MAALEASLAEVRSHTRGGRNGASSGNGRTKWSCPCA